MGITNNPDQAITDYMPYVTAWIGALERDVKDVIDLTVTNEIVRDKEREAVEQNGWQYHKLTGNQTVTLTFTDRSVQTRTFTKSERDTHPSGASLTKE